MKRYTSERSRLFVSPLLGSASCGEYEVGSVYDSLLFAVRQGPSTPARHAHAGKTHLLLGALLFNGFTLSPEHMLLYLLC